jgi:hypothetical protein
MLGFLQDWGNYADRKVGRDSYPHGWISTAAVSDGAKPYETAVNDSRYSRANGEKEMVIVDAYDTIEDARAGHAKWLAAMTADAPPLYLDDCFNSEVGRLAASLTDEPDYLRQTLDARAEGRS